MNQNPYESPTSAQNVEPEVRDRARFGLGGCPFILLGLATLLVAFVAARLVLSGPSADLVSLAFLIAMLAAIGCGSILHAFRRSKLTLGMIVLLMLSFVTSFVWMVVRA